MTNKKIVAITLMLAFLVIATASAATDFNTPITETTLYDSEFNIPWHNTYNAFAVPFENVSDLSTSYYEEAEAYGDGYYSYLNFWVDLNDGDSINYTYTLMGGRTITGWAIKQPSQYMGFVDASTVTICMDDVIDSQQHVKWPILSDTETCKWTYWNNSYAGQLGIGVMSEHSKLIITPLLSGNDVMSSLYVTRHSGSPKLHVYSVLMAASWYDITSNNSSWGNSNGTWFGTNNPLAQILDLTFQVFGLAGTLFSASFYALGIIIGLLTFFLNPINFIATILVLEFTGLALSINFASNIFDAAIAFINFNIHLISSILFFIEITIRFLYWFFEILVAMPQILSQAAELAAGFIGMVAVAAKTILKIIV